MWIGLLLSTGCEQIAPPNQNTQGDLAATVTAHVTKTLESSTFDSTLITEAQTVQSAIDLWMVETGQLPSAQTDISDDLSSSNPALSPMYIRKSLTECGYSWDSAGRTTQHC